MKSQELKEEHFTGRSWERKLYSPLVGESMLELGNKRKNKMLYKDVFQRLGFRHVSVDMNGLDGALKLDLRKPLNLGTFDMVTNIGTSEHVSQHDFNGQIACWRNIVEAMHIGSVLVSIGPLQGSPKWLRHGRWYAQPQFYRELAELNGLEAERIYADSNQVYARLRKTEQVDFIMPLTGMYRNPNDLNKVDNY